MSLKCDGVFEGGGVKGIGLVGGAKAILDAGYEFENVAGSSAGAIVASLLAAGYTAEELKVVLESTDYLKFKEGTLLDHFSAIGKLLSISIEYGIYSADYFELWISGLLAKKGKVIFSDFYKNENCGKECKYRFQAIASDLTDRRMLVLPRDLQSLGIDPDGFSIARAVRMSMSIPIFYEPYRLIDGAGREHIIVDGGLLSNYPIWLLDDGVSSPSRPVFGFKFTRDSESGQNMGEGQPINNIIEYMKALVATLLEAQDNYHVSVTKGDFQRTVFIPTEVMVNGKTKDIHTTDFDITKKESLALFENGLKAGQSFLKHWNFEIWRKMFRDKKT